MNNAAYVLGIDIGTTGARVGIFDLKGNPVVFCSENFPLYTPASGRAEQDANDWWEAVCHKHPSGTHMVVRKQNVQDILAQTKG